MKEIGPSTLLVVLSLIAFICGLVDFNVNVNAPKAIALCWVIYNIVPHALLLIYSRWGAGALSSRQLSISLVHVIFHCACGLSRAAGALA